VGTILCYYFCSHVKQMNDMEEHDAMMEIGESNVSIFPLGDFGYLRDILIILTRYLDTRWVPIPDSKPKNAPFINSTREVGAYLLCT